MAIEQTVEHRQLLHRRCGHPVALTASIGDLTDGAKAANLMARTAAARTLSRTARVVLKVSVDGDITIFQGGSEVATLLGRTTVGGH